MTATSSDRARSDGRPVAVSRELRQSGEAPTWPFVLLLVYVFIEFVRPQYFVPALGLVRPGLLIAVALTGYWIVTYGIKQICGDRLITYFLLFTAMALAWVPFASNNFWALNRSQFLAILFLSATIPLSLLLVPHARRRQFMKLWVGAHAYLAVFAMTHNGFGPGSFLFDENDLALALCTGLPYPFLLAQRHGEKALVRAVYYAIALVMALGIVYTNSRGGFVGLLAVALYMWWVSRNRIRNALIAVLLAGLTVVLAPAGYFDEMRSINDTEDSTRVGRILQWRIGWAMFADNPIAGVGTANYPWRASEYHQTLPDYDPAGRQYGGRAAHSLYFTLLPEFGMVGTSLFVLIVVGMMRRLKDCERRLIRDAEQGNDDAAWDYVLSKAIRASLIGYLVAGAFISVLIYPPVWYSIGFVVALSRDVTRK